MATGMALASSAVLAQSQDATQTDATGVARHALAAIAPDDVVTFDRNAAIARAGELINNIRQRLDNCGEHGMLGLDPSPSSPARLDQTASGQTTLDQPTLHRTPAGSNSAEPASSAATEKRPDLRYNAQLAVAAGNHSRAMATHGFFDHTDTSGHTVGKRVTQTGYRWQRVGENLAAGHRSVDEAVQGWLLSPGHCEVMIDPRFSEFGLAREVARNPDDRYGVYWTLVVAQP